VNLSANPKGGIEDEYLSLYFLMYNITTNYVNDFPYNGLDMEKIFTCLQSLWARESDMVFGSLPLVSGNAVNAEPTFPYFAVDLNWFVPCPKPL
jgi:hypothetical protein